MPHKMPNHGGKPSFHCFKILDIYYYLMHIHKAIILCSLTRSAAFMFQSNNRLLQRTVTLHMSSVQSLAPKVREKGKVVLNRGAEDSSRQKLSSRSKRMIKTVPSGQVQIPIHIRIAKVSDRYNCLPLNETIYSNLTNNSPHRQYGRNLFLG
jgi:hypothetical protein